MSRVVLRDWVTVVDPSEMSTDRNGNPIIDWGSGLTEPAEVQPITVSDGREAAPQLGGTMVQRRRLLLGPVTSVGSRARVNHHGDVYEVDGEVEQVRTARGGIHHHEAYLRRVADR